MPSESPMYRHEVNHRLAWDKSFVRRLSESLITHERGAHPHHHENEIFKYLWKDQGAKNKKR